MKDDKTPGSDGLPKEFYLEFWNSVSDLLIKSYTYSFEVGTLSIEQRRGKIRLITKKRKKNFSKNTGDLLVSKTLMQNYCLFVPHTDFKQFFLQLLIMNRMSLSRAFHRL